MIKPRCKKCGKVLRDPESIALGMTPKCAGLSSGRRTVNVKVDRRGGSPYSLGILGGMQATLPIMDTTLKNLSKTELVICSREERRRLFNERKPFHCGLSLPERKPIIYTPTHDGAWKNTDNESVISHEQLQSYLNCKHPQSLL